MEGDDLCSSKVKNKQPYPASALAERPPMKGALNEDILYCHSDTWKALRKTMMRYVYEGLGDFCHPKVYNSLPIGNVVLAKEVCNRTDVISQL